MSWWGKKGPDKPSVESHDAASKSSRPVAGHDANQPERSKLPPKLQKMVDKSDKEDNFFDELVDGYAPASTDSKVRYAGYAARFRTILASAHRYVAYTSDIGESFRPVAHPLAVRAAYGVSWAYILGDVGYEGYKAYAHNQRARDPQLELAARQRQPTGMGDVPDAPAAAAPPPGHVAPLEDYRVVMVQRGLFQSIASMGLPALTIHSVVRYSGRALQGVRNRTLRTWGPIGLGLAVVPALPSLFDKPVENAVESVFHKGFETLGGKEAVGASPLIGREKRLSQKPKEKEL